MDITAVAASLPIDWVIIASAMVLIALESFRAGTARAATLALAFLLSFYLFDALQNAYFLGSEISKLTMPLALSILYVALLAATYFFISRVISSFDVGGGITTAVLCAVATVIIVIVTWVQTPALMDLWRFSTTIQTAFGEAYRFYWSFLALGLLAFVRS